MRHERHRPFGEAGILREQPLVLDQVEPGVQGELAGAVEDRCFGALAGRA